MKGSGGEFKASEETKKASENIASRVLEMWGILCPEWMVFMQVSNRSVVRGKQLLKL